jgi:hypothetical protein
MRICVDSRLRPPQALGWDIRENGGFPYFFKAIFVIERLEKF